MSKLSLYISKAFRLRRRIIICKIPINIFSPKFFSIPVRLSKFYIIKYFVFLTILQYECNVYGIE